MVKLSRPHLWRWSMYYDENAETSSKVRELGISYRRKHHYFCRHL